MRHLLHISLLLVLLSVAVIGCRPTTSDAERRLIALDSLIATAPDSALTQLSATDTATLSEPERAYHALLLTQAMYKAYVPATSDSLIGRAWRYYEHSGPYDRRVRALLYQGTVAEELGHLEKAMHWYKQAEDYARPDDHYNRAYILMRQGTLYQFQYTSTELAIEKYKKSLSLFMLCNHKSYQTKCLTNLGMMYRLINVDSAVWYSHQAIKMSLEIGDSATYFSNIESLAGLYQDNKDWQNTKYYAMMVVNHGMNKNLHSCYYYAAQAYLHLGNMDSAYAVFRLAPEPATVRDSILFFRTKSIFEEKDKDFRLSMIDAERAGTVASKAIWGKAKHDIHGVEQNVDKRKLENQVNQLTGKTHHYGVIISVVLIALVAFVLFANKRYRVIKQRLDESNASLVKARQQIADAMQQVSEKELSLQYVSHNTEILQCDKVETTNESHTNQPKVEEHFAENQLQIQKKCLTQLFNSVVYSGSRGASIFKYIFDIERNEHVSLISVKLPEAFWEDVEQYIQLEFPGAMEQLQSEGHHLREKEKRLIYLDCLGIPNAAVAVALGYGERSVASIRFKLTTKLNCQSKPFVDILREKSK